MSFEISDNKGFTITYQNGYTVSVQFGSGNYCTNRDLPYGEEVPPSDTAETALMTKDGFVEYQGDDVQGHMSPADVLKLMVFAESLKPYDELDAFVAGLNPQAEKEGSFYGYNEKSDNFVPGLDD
tara:strand:- start:301 stop:675 length:375 start_codon:yes stop_codon:yes gene_type:complete